MTKVLTHKVKIQNIEIPCIAFASNKIAFAYPLAMVAPNRTDPLPISPRIDTPLHLQPVVLAVVRIYVRPRTFVRPHDSVMNPGQLVLLVSELGDVALNSLQTLNETLLLFSRHNVIPRLQDPRVRHT